MTLTRGIWLPRQRGADFAHGVIQPAFHFFGQACQGRNLIFQFSDPAQQQFPLGFQLGDPFRQLGGTIQGLADRSGGVFQSLKRLKEAAR